VSTGPTLHRLPENELWELIRRCVRLMNTEKRFERYLGSQSAGATDPDERLVSQTVEIPPDLRIIKSLRTATHTIELRVMSYGVTGERDPGMIFRALAKDTFECSLDDILWGNADEEPYALRILRNYMVLDDMAQV
jgi:hypothetical protein